MWLSGCRLRADLVFILRLRNKPPLRCMGSTLPKRNCLFQPFQRVLWVISVYDTKAVKSCDTAIRIKERWLQMALVAVQKKVTQLDKFFNPHLMHRFMRVFTKLSTVYT